MFEEENPMISLWARGLSTDLEVIAFTGQRKSLELQLVDDKRAIFSKNSIDRLYIQQIETITDDPSAVILQNQQKLRDHSSTRSLQSKSSTTSIDNMKQFNKLSKDNLVKSHSNKNELDSILKVDNIYLSDQYRNASNALLDDIRQNTNSENSEFIKTSQLAQLLKDPPNISSRYELCHNDDTSSILDDFEKELLGPSNFFGSTNITNSEQVKTSNLTSTEDNLFANSKFNETNLLNVIEKRINEQDPSIATRKLVGVKVTTSLDSNITKEINNLLKDEDIFKDELDVIDQEQEEKKLLAEKFITEMDEIQENFETIKLRTTNSISFDVETSVDEGTTSETHDIERLNIDDQLEGIDSDWDNLVSSVENIKKIGEENIELDVKQLDQTSWAITSPLDESEFDNLRPKLAMQYPFELDFFQKQAIMRLERHECVFVAAHTSAGKTVVAEYAISMARRHVTRAIYTSPIKALSNQKYRDFREKFGANEVGIITGDVSVNPEASCLIMTTEILRSMLYRGADTIKDIEWVIFDEVHYVNDIERGVVWEEVIIMLPERIGLVFLSATTPNTIEFCDWIGRTKRRKVYVISTNKRPVPLQHFLFHEDEAYKIMQGDKGYNSHAVSQAMNHAKNKNKPKDKSNENKQMSDQRSQEKLANAAQAMGKSIKSVGNQNTKTPIKSSGPSGPVGNVDSGGSKAQWTRLIQVLRDGGREAAGGLNEIHFGVATNTNVLSKKARQDKNANYIKYEKLPKELQAKISKKEYESQQQFLDEDDAEEGVNREVGLLPVVVFSFSKNKCEIIADFLKGMNLLTSREKGKVHSIFQQVKKRLNPLDASLPQVQRVEDLLSCGIGIHHSGLLPLLKECVELLFSLSIVKVLLATETFAMGVNMPARCVCFNGFRKHDGKSFRDLLPGEYIQMAGRAGRRGLDKVGTVMICLWNDVPYESILKRLLTGTATKLSSQFRLSYNMILNLLRVNDLSVEDMIKRSFSEFHSQSALSKHDLSTRLKKYELLLKKLESQQAKEEESTNATEELENYVLEMQKSQQLLNDYLSSLYVMKGYSSDFVTSTILKVGRVVFVHSGALPCPCLGVIITKPSRFSLTSKVKSPTPSTPMNSPTKGSNLQMNEVLLECWVVLLLPSLTSHKTNETNEDLASASDNQEFQEMLGFFNVNTQQLQTINEDNIHILNTQDNTGIAFCVKRVRVSEIALISSLVIDVNMSSTNSNESIVLNSSKKIKKSDKQSQKQPSNANSSISNVKLSLDDLNSLRSPTSKASMDIELTSNPILSSKQKNIILSKALSTLTILQLESYSSLSYYEFKDAKISNDMTIIDKQNALIRSVAMIQSYHLNGMLFRFHDYNRIFKILKLREKTKSLRYLISNQNLTLFPDFQQRLCILKILGYVDTNHDIVTLKGRVACEMNTCDELIATEMLFQNILEPLNPPECAGILSAFVFQEKTKDEKVLTTRMEEAKNSLVTSLEVLLQLQEEEGVTIDIDMKPSLNFGLSDVVYQWARGVPFREITEMTSTHEGSIVRCITRLDELCKDIRNAARVIGNPSLYRKMEAASQCIKRDIVFAASLYIT